MIRICKPNTIPALGSFSQAVSCLSRSKSKLRSLVGFACGFYLAASSSAQLSSPAWPKMLGNAQNTGFSIGAGTIPVVKWSRQISNDQNPPDVRPVIGADGTVYLGEDGSFYALDGVTGAIKWTFAAGGLATDVPYAALAANGLVYVEYDGALIALDSTTGSLKWTVSSAGASSPSVGPDGTVYVGTTAGFSALDPNTGIAKWTIDAYLAPFEVPAFGTDGTIYFAGNGTNGLYGIFTVNPTTGSFTYGSTAQNGYPNTSPIVGADGGLFSSYSGYLYSYVTSAGGSNWTDLLYGLSGTALGPNGHIYVTAGLTGDPAKLIEIDPKTGAQLSSFTIPDRLASLIIGGDGTIYGIGASSGQTGIDEAVLYAINPQTGGVNWSIPNMGPSAMSSIALGADGTLVFGQGNNIVALKSINVVNVALSPSTVQGGSNSTCTVTLNQPAPSGGWVVSLSSDNVNAQVPSTVSVPAGQISASFPVTTTVVATQVTADISAQPGVFQSATLTITPPPLTSVSVNPTSVTAGAGATGTVTIGGVAPTSGLVVLLSSSSSAVKVPASVNILSGASTATFAITTSGVDGTTPAIITGTLNNQPQTATLTVNPAALTSIALNPTSVLGGTNSTGTVTLNGPAGPSGDVVSLTSGNAAATAPGSVTILPGKLSATFTVNTTGVNSQTAAVITGTLNAIPQSATLTITSTALVSLSLSPSSVLGGGASTGTVTLSGPAATGGTVVNLTSSNSAATVPGSVTISAGQKVGTFSISTVGVNNSTAALITATLNSQPQSATLTITPAALTSLALSPTSVLGGGASTGTVTLSGPAGSGGTVVALQSGNSAATVPASVMVPAGSNSATFTVSTIGVNSQTTSAITATLNGTPKSATLTITPAELTGLFLNPSTVSGGTSSSGTVSLSGPAGPGGTVVGLSSSSSAAAVPASVTIPAGQKTASFAIATVGVSSLTYSTISASLNGITLTASLAITATTLASINLNPSTVAGVAVSTGTLQLTGPAGAGGLIVNVSSSSPSATVPATVSIPAGQSTATFTISASSVTSQTVVTMTATLGTTSKTATLTLTPIALASLNFNPSTVTGGTSTSGTVALNGFAPKGGLVVKLTSTSPSVTVPASVTILAGSSSAKFTATTKGVAVEDGVLVTAKLGTETQSATLLLEPPVLSSLTLSINSVVGGTPTTGSVTLSGPAPSGGMVIRLSSSSSAATVVASITVLAGKTTAVFSVKTIPVGVKTVATITGSAAGSTQSATLTINPPTLMTLTLSPSSVAGGKSSTGTVTIGNAAPTGGLLITLASSLSAATPPTTVTIAVGKTSATFTVKTTKVTSKSSATISAAFNGTTKTANLTIS